MVTSPISPGVSGLSTFCFDYSNVLWKDSTGATTTATTTGCSPIWVASGNISPN